MNILILANFPSKLDGKANGRFIYLAEMLTARGHEVELVTSDFQHSSKSRRKVEPGWYKTKVTLISEPGYQRNISIRRLWSHYRWGCSVEKYMKKRRKPDVVYCAVPSLTVGVRAARYCKQNGVKFIIDVQDLWPEAFAIAIKNKLLQKLFLPMEWYVNKIYKAADTVVAVSETYVQRALSVSRKGADGLSVFLGNDGAVFDDARGEIKPSYQPETLQLAYIGTLGYSYDLKCVIEALAIYSRKEDAPRMRFIVMGRGPLSDEFMQYAKEKKVDCEFTGALPYTDMVARMCQCDIVVNPIVSGSAASITNKLGDYALSGLPVVNTQESPEYRKLIDDYECGINCGVGNAEEVADALYKLAKDSELRKKMGEGARRLGVEKFDRRETYQQIAETAGITPPQNEVLKICYIGTLGYSYDLKCAIDAIAIYNKVEGMPAMQFVIMGRGPLREEFENYAKEREVDAVFTGALPYLEMVPRMCSCDILINPIVKGAAQSITNKVGDYALAGLPVVSTQENQEYRDLLEQYQCGINCRVGNAQDVANALVRLAKDKELRKTMGKNARRFGIERFDRRHTYMAIVRMIEN